ncbi:MAG: hypothetical protein AB1611_10220 [bacterium]
MSIEVMELFNIFSKAFSKEEAQTIVKDIETLISDHRRELSTKEDLKEIELKLTAHILSTKEDLKETELKLTAHIKEVELKLNKEIESLRLELSKEIESLRLELSKEIESVRLEIESVRLEVERAKSSTIKWIVGWVAGLLIAYTGAIFTILTLLR